MTDIIDRLKSSVANGEADSTLLGEALQEITELRKRRDALEEILIILARTELPWDEDGKPTDALPHFKERYLKTMHEASEMLGLELRSTITRTEPRT
ncbi:MAG: hypothetical protein A2075_04985 [Geobacteraceae bacterium GWC2_58_44]|nr:MAG: hypothetical protein A2075_04985 [Geobacteraceae bacterium GWC2_58_44]HBG07263.1 hypothetical protein [Geobacter sp.]